MKLNRFNVIAPYYDQLASLVFGKAIQDSQTYYLKQIPDAAKVLVLGGGTAWWLPQLQKEKPFCEIWFIEASSEMLLRATKNSTGNFVPIHGTEEDIPAIQFDAVITYFFLDLFDESEISKVINRINSSLKINGIWIVSDFVSTKYWHRMLLFLMYSFFSLIGSLHTKKLSDWRGKLLEVKLECTHQAFFFAEFIAGSVYRKTSQE